MLRWNLFPCTSCSNHPITHTTHTIIVTITITVTITATITITITLIITITILNVFTLPRVWYDACPVARLTAHEQGFYTLVTSTQLLLLHCSIASMQLRSPVDTSAVEQQRSLTMVTSLNSLLPLFVTDPKKSPDNAGIWWLSCQFFGMHRFQLGCHNADWLAVFTRSQRKWGIIKLLLTSFASVFWPVCMFLIS